MKQIKQKAWWARQGLNLRPLRCEHKAYFQEPQKTASLSGTVAGTRRERTAILAHFYRKFTATLTERSA